MRPVCPHCGQALPEFGGIICDDNRGEIRFRGKFIRNLTSHEFMLFRMLLDAKGRAISKENILTLLYSARVIADDEVPEIKIVDVFICKLRRKLKPLGIELATIWGRGYRVEEPNKDEAAA